MGFKVFLTFFAILVFVGTHFCSVIRLSNFWEKQLVTDNYYNTLGVHSEDNVMLQGNADTDEHSQRHGENDQCEGPRWQKLKEVVKYVVAEQNNKEIKKKKGIKKKSFVIHLGPVNWYKAWELCAHDGKRLASINSKEEQDEVVQVIQSKGSSHVRIWLGGQNLITENGTYVWVASGQYLTYTNWNYNEPNNQHSEEHCIEIHNSGKNKWNDFICSESKHDYICEYS